MAKHSTLNGEGHEWFWGVSIDELNLDLFFWRWVFHLISAMGFFDIWNDLRNVLEVSNVISFQQIEEAYWDVPGI